MKSDFPFDDLRTLSIAGYFGRYEDECKKQTTFKQAWVRTEEVYKSITGHARYTSYDAFRMALSRYRRKL